MFSQTAEYALRAVVFLAAQDGVPRTTQEIARATQVPTGYLSKVMQGLGRARLVLSQRGLHGGFTLARPAAELTVLDIIQAVDPIQRIRSCPLGPEGPYQSLPSASPPRSGDETGRGGAAAIQHRRTAGRAGTRPRHPHPLVLLAGRRVNSSRPLVAAILANGLRFIMPSLLHCRHFLLSFLFLFAVSRPATAADEKDWIDLSNLEAWRKPDAAWLLADSVGVDADNARLLSARAGRSILVNGRKGRARDLLSKQAFGDIEVHVEFLLPTGSNSGVKLQGLYEIQICDSWGVKDPKGSDCGGIYPRRTEADVSLSRQGRAAAHQCVPATGRVADTGHPLFGAALRRRRQEDGQRALRPGRPQRADHSRERRDADADRPCLARHGIGDWPAAPAGRSRAHRLSPCPRAPYTPAIKKD